MSQVLTVSQINTYIKFLIEDAEPLKRLYVSGEISNLSSHYKSGHIYFSLKDEKSVLKAVMFATSAKRLRFAPKDGMKVLIRGRISVYEPSGQYQLYAEDMQPEGLGALNLAYEQLKEKLEKEGLFNQERKRPLPMYPKQVAVITSPTGAAVQDVLRILGRRWPVAEVALYPCTVQGENAVPELLAAMEAVNRENKADVIIIGRGGGSLEDLWAFNSEALARAVFNSKIPVISAVGHETDFTICDFVADLRASTPSAAAELCVPNIEEELAGLEGLYYTLLSGMRRRLESCGQRLDSLPQPELLLRRRIDQGKSLVQSKQRELALHAGSAVLGYKNRLEGLAGRLDAMSPLKVLARGYAIINKEDTVVSNIAHVNMGDMLTARLSQGSLELKVEGIIKKD